VRVVITSRLAFPAEPSGGELHCLDGSLIQPVSVVDQRQLRLLGRSRAEQAEGCGADDELISRARRAVASALRHWSLGRIHAGKHSKAKTGQWSRKPVIGTSGHRSSRSVWHLQQTAETIIDT
jgi:hypothetical protein